uniref:ADP/ATP translocase n=1 Tax=Caenorhabditis japonica TaxID=281687 RepID=A0A8R1IEF2_CAEJA
MIIYRGAYYGLFDTTAPYMNRDGKMTFTQAFLVGQVVTLIAAMTSYPLDTVRRRLMMGAGNKVIPFHNTISCIKAKKLGKIERDALAAKMSADEAFVEWSVNSSQPLNRTDAGHDLEVEHEEEIEDADPDGSTNEMEAKAAVVIQKMIRGFLVRRRLREKIENMRERAHNYNRVLAHEDEQFAIAGRTVAATTSSIEAKLRKSTLHGLTNANLHLVHLGATIIGKKVSDSQCKKKLMKLKIVYEGLT